VKPKHVVQKRLLCLQQLALNSKFFLFKHAAKLIFSSRTKAFWQLIRLWIGCNSRTSPGTRWRII
jgi:hypothetical protein